jgi:hypothetical protein
MEDLEINNKTLIRFMDQKNYNEAEEYTNKVVEILSRRRSVRGGSLGKSIRNNNTISDEPE